MASSYTFGLDKEQLDPEQFGGFDPSLLDDPNATWMDKILRFTQARDRIAATGVQEEPPQPVTLPRVKEEAENPSFFAKNPALGKGVDAGLATLTLLSNLRNVKRNNAAGRTRGQVPLLDFAAMPTITGRLKSERERKAKESLGIQKHNVDTAETEAKINESAMARYAARRNAQMAPILPSLTKAAFRDPASSTRAAPVFQQKLAALKESEAWLTADPKRRNEMELHVLGAAPKTPNDTASDYAKAYTRLQAKLDFQKRNPGAAGGKDIGEIDIADMAKYMQGLVVNDFIDPDKAADMALEYGRNKMKLRGAVGKDPTFTPGAMAPPPPPPAGATGPGAAVSPTGLWRENAQTAGLPPDIAHKIKVYASLKGKHAQDDPGKVSAIREDIRRTYGIDPDVYLEPAPLLQPGQ